MASTESMKVSFRVKEYGTSTPLPYIIEVESGSKPLSILAGESDTLYLRLRKENDEKEAYQVVKFLREHIAEIVLVKAP